MRKIPTTTKNGLYHNNDVRPTPIASAATAAAAAGATAAGVVEIKLEQDHRAELSATGAFGAWWPQPTRKKHRVDTNHRSH